MESKLIVLTGPSGVGKTTIVEALVKSKSLSLEKVKTTTTRQKRSADDNYYFVSIEEFKKKIDDVEFLEYEEVYEGVLYGVEFSELERIRSTGNTPIVVLDCEGARKLSFRSDVLVICLMVNKDLLVERLKERNSDKNLSDRIKKLDQEIELCNKRFDFIVFNDQDLSDTLKEIKNTLCLFLNKPKYETLVVNFFGGPGTGKSTMRAAVFSELKFLGINCEEATEYAKDKVWEGSLNILKNQTYLFGKQQHRLYRLLDKVDCIITDAPLLMQRIYCDDLLLSSYIEKESKKFNNLNIFLEREKEYNPAGRTQTFEEAKVKDEEIKKVLKNSEVISHIFKAKKESVKSIVDLILSKI